MSELSQTSAAGRVVGFRNDRLGARLNAIANARRLATILDAPLGIVWPDHEGTSPELRNPEQLFNEAFIANHFLRDVNVADLMAGSLPLDGMGPAPERDTVLERLRGGGTVLVSHSHSLAYVAGENHDGLREQVAAQISPDILTPVMRDALKVLGEALPKGKSIAYHLRRGDIIDSALHASQTLWSNKYVPRVFYEAHMRKMLAEHGDDLNILVFSDAPAEIGRFRDAGIPVKSLDDVMDTSTLTMLQRDTLELLAMGRCQPIYAPSSSAFSTVAATLGGSFIVPLIEDLTAEARTEAMELLTRRLQSEHDSFLGDADLGQNLPYMIRHQVAAGNSQVILPILYALQDRGFDRAYLPNLIAQELMRTQDWPATEKQLAKRATAPIPLRNASTISTCYAAMTALAAAPLETAFALASAALYAMPLHPHSRSIAGILAQDAPAGFMPPVDILMLRARPVLGGVYAHEQRPILQAFAARPEMAERSRGTFPVLPVDLDMRDWIHLQRPDLPGPFRSRAKALSQLNMLRMGYGRDKMMPHFQAAESVLMRDAGDFEDAMAAIDSALAQAPDTALYHKRRADILLAMSDLEGAEASYRRAAEIADQCPFHAADLANFLAQNDQKREAKKVFLHLCEVEHNFVGLHLQIASRLRNRQTREKAHAMMDRAMALLPTELPVIRMKLRLLEADGREDEAEILRARLPKPAVMAAPTQQKADT